MICRNKLDCVVGLACLKRAGEEKINQKSTYPPPADGLCVFFLCKPGCSANDPAAQAGCGLLEGIGHCTKCKVLNGNAARLHSGTQGVHGGVILVAPVSLGENFENMGFGGFSKSTTLISGEQNALTNVDRFAGQSHGLREFWCF